MCLQAFQPAPSRPTPAPVAAGRAVAPAHPLALEIGLGLVLFVIYWICVRRYIVYDGDMMIRVTRSIATQGSLYIQDPIFHVSEPYSYYGLGVSLLLLPLFALGQFLFHDGVVLLSVFEPLVTALTVVALMRLLVDLGVSWSRSLTIALLYAFGSLAWHYSGVLYSDQLVTLMLTAAVLCALRYSPSHFSGEPMASGSRDFPRGFRRRWAFAAGAALALALLARWDVLLLIILPVSAFLLWQIRNHLRPLLPRILDAAVFAAPILAVVGVNVAYDILRYGRPLGGPYGTVVSFTTPLFTGLYGLLLSPGDGLLVFVPVLLLAPFGVRALYRRYPSIAVLIVALVLVRLFFYARWGDWDGGASWGPRFMITTLPLLFVLLAFLPRAPMMRAALIVLGALSVGVELVGQLVPYGMYWTRAVAELSNSPAVVQGCAGCNLGNRNEFINQIIDFNPHYAPLVGQLGMIRQGFIDPTWANLALVVPLLLIVFGIVFFRLRRQALSLDRSTPSMQTP